MDIFIIVTTTIIGGGLWDPGVFEELTSQGGRRLEVTDEEGSLHNSSCTLLIEMRMGNYELYTEELRKKFKRMTQEKQGKILVVTYRKGSVSLVHFKNRNKDIIF